jgi:peptidoglycan hydrolase-like protein with peptidoglycan-binding domain
MLNPAHGLTSCDTAFTTERSTDEYLPRGNSGDLFHVDVWQGDGKLAPGEAFMVKRAGSLVAAAAVALTLVAGCGSDDGTPSAAPDPGVTSAPVSSQPAAPEPSASEPSAATPAPDPTTSAPAKPATPKSDKLRQGDKGPAITVLQERLTELGYWNGKADGKFGGSTQQAIFALQKAAGIDRDGVVGNKTRKALKAGVQPTAKSDSGYVVEINKKKQLLMLVQDGKVLQTFNTSTGSGREYETDSGGTAIASTPAGKFKIGRQINGWRDAPLGMLWRPKYFNGGIAVHGANSVPPYAASHGCARLSISAMNYLWSNDKLPIKTKVWVY